VSAALVTQTIQLIIAPVVMVSACGVILNGLLSRYASVNDRLRTMAHERWDLIRTMRTSGDGSSEPDPNIVERLQEIDIQIPQLLRRHHQLRNAVLLLYVALLCFIVCMFLIAAGTLLDVQPLATATLTIFLFGAGFLLVGVSWTVLEVYHSHVALTYEAERVLSLGRSHPR
jgi:hypothetical protein